MINWLFYSWKNLWIKNNTYWRTTKESSHNLLFIGFTMEKIKKININMLKSQNYQTLTKIQLINNFKINNKTLKKELLMNFAYDIFLKKL